MKQREGRGCCSCTFTPHSSVPPRPCGRSGPDNPVPGCSLKGCPGDQKWGVDFSWWGEFHKWRPPRKTHRWCVLGEGGGARDCVWAPSLPATRLPFSWVLIGLMEDLSPLLASQSILSFLVQLPLCQHESSSREGIFSAQLLLFCGWINDLQVSVTCCSQF